MTRAMFWAALTLSLQLADAHQSVRGIELNPIARPLVSHPAAFYAVKLGAGGLVLAGAHEIRKAGQPMREQQRDLRGVRGLASFPSLPRDKTASRKANDHEPVIGGHGKTVPAWRGLVGIFCFASGFFVIGWAVNGAGIRFAARLVAGLALFMGAGAALFW